ncbi:SubName: Full=Uncharacterized protein {ECO:0000313/EMBL:CCA68638.1} [Serendipita indica DSM 11827]|nr:SubName: Full=Uncharacterized protein {ECO:0000313/EMBL:CCA68638.1} [Serendipita indica DSM 11827]
MSEYWVSNKKYFCKYCEIFIADDAPSRTQHENGLRHKGKKEQFIRNLYKSGEKKKREQEEERKEMARIELAAQASFAGDVQSGRAKGSTSSYTALPKPSAPKPAVKSGPSMANYTTARDLGIAQEEEEKMAKAIAMAQSQGVVGQWEVVETTTPTASALPQKRPLEDDEDEEGEGYRVRRKKLAEGLGEIYDPGVITLIPKKQPENEIEAPTVQSEKEPKVPAPLKWSTKRWKTGDADPDVDATSDNEQPTQLNEVVETQSADALTERHVQDPPSLTEEKPQDQPKPTEEVAPTKSMFKKRKGPSQSVGTKTGARKQL